MHKTLSPTQVGHNLRSCSGNMYGTAEAVHTYSKMMEDEQMRTSVDGRWCADQAVHQALLWQGKFGAAMKNLTIHHNHDGPVATVGNILKYTVNTEQDVCPGGGDKDDGAITKPYAIVHQYDRQNYILDTAKARYADDTAGGDMHMNPRYVDDYEPRKWSMTQKPPRTVAAHKGQGENAEGGGDRVGWGTPRDPPVLSVRGPFEEEEGRGGGYVASEEEWPHVEAIQHIITNPSPYPPWMYQDQGVVMSAGGGLQFANAYIAISALRNTGCHLPVELFHAGQAELSSEAISLLHSLADVHVVDMLRMPGMDSMDPLSGWQIKAFAILHSSFAEVIWMDSDNYPLHDVQDLFYEPSYLEHGCLFWQDFSVDPHWLQASWFHQYGVEMSVGEREFEAGQLVIDKERCWKALQVVVYMNEKYT